MHHVKVLEYCKLYAAQDSEPRAVHHTWIILPIFPRDLLVRFRTCYLTPMFAATAFPRLRPFSNTSHRRLKQVKNRRLAVG
jgi:hypothetical protein